MGISAQFEPGDIKKQLNAAIKDGMETLARDHTRMIESLGRRYRGRPIVEIKPALQREWRRVNGGNITDPELTDVAQAISDGTKIEFKNRGTRR